MKNYYTAEDIRQWAETRLSETTDDFARQMCEQARLYAAFLAYDLTIAHPANEDEFAKVIQFELGKSAA